MEKKTFLKSAAVLALAVLLVVFGDTKPASRARAFVSSTSAPLMHAASSARNFILWLSPSLSHEEASALISENQHLKARLFELEELKRNNVELRKALGFKEDNIPLLGVDVAHYGREFGREFMLVKGGQENGIAKGDLVIDYNGFLVGSVSEADASFSKIEIASNPGMVFEVEMASFPAKILAKGTGNRAIQLELIPALMKVEKGYFAAATHAGWKTFFPLAEVVRVKEEGNAAFKEASAVLLARPEYLREVFIVLSPQRQ